MGIFRVRCDYFLVMLVFTILSEALAQTPSGMIYGLIYGPTEEVIAGCRITIRESDAGTTRTLVSSQDGVFSFSVLPVGTYSVLAQMQGFASSQATVTVNAGSATRVDLHLQRGVPGEEITVYGEPLKLNYSTAAVTGLVTRFQIESLPLNGRNFLQLASLEPGISVIPGYLGLFNRQFDVSFLGGNKYHSRVTVDGGSIWDPTTGGTALNLSQEVVQEFQTSSANFDLSVGVSAYGAVNVVTRSGGNTTHGAAYLYYRDNNFSAYPGLGRTPLTHDPYFARKQPGLWVSGPIQKERLFYFFSLEKNLQDSVFIVTPSSPLLASLAEVAPSPYRGTQITSRLDYVRSDSSTLTLRYSHDGNSTIAPPSTQVVPASNWQQNRNWSDQGQLTLASRSKPALTNELRLSFWYWSNRNLAISRDDCTASCAGYGLPEIRVLGSNVSVGMADNTPQGRFSRIWTYQDNLTWSHGNHRVLFGGEFTHENVAGYWDLADPAIIDVYSPDLLSRLGLLRSYGLTSAGVVTPSDILKLPLRSFTVGVGDPTQPQPYNRAGARQNNRTHIYSEDAWRLRPNLALNYGLAWSYESNLLNYDLPKPVFLDTILGASGPRSGNHNYRNFSPSLGVAWNVGKENRTVIRAGASIYYDTQLLWQRGEERSYLGPFPNGHVILSGSSIPNPLPGITGAPQGIPINYTDAPTGFAAGTLLGLLPALRDALTNIFSVPGTNLSLPTIDIAKSASHLLPRVFPSTYSEHFSVGVQRMLPGDIALSADLVFRLTLHTLFDDINAPDYNHFNAASGPRIPACVGAQAADPAALCSAGPITVWTPGGRDHYKGLLIKANRFVGDRLSVQVSYALASQKGFDASLGFADLNNWFANYGSLGPRHSLNVSAVVALPAKLELSLISAYTSALPAAPYISQIDLNGSGTTYSLLPGAPFNCFNRGCDAGALRHLVAQFNQTLVGKRTPGGQLIPALELPSRFLLGSAVTTQDVRLTRTFSFKDKISFRVFAEMFNALNCGNPTGFNLDLNSAGFGQATQRIGQTFGSGGPRALQLGTRLSF